MENLEKIKQANNQAAQSNPINNDSKILEINQFLNQLKLLNVSSEFKNTIFSILQANQEITAKLNLYTGAILSGMINEKSDRVLVPFAKLEEIEELNVQLGFQIYEEDDKSRTIEFTVKRLTNA